ncbi:UDP-N-acetylglucosamine--undecaprenyl-phosphate N-acetylglucosaminephosphotransferase [Vibrio salinus]|uniref:UDP-N-acetylglucosamine--undecaprenyl-phosphate N-acetylglucosaminephosphotransferase n=1 Tax=Vibrio salinus TaxID=2899784 RepID=UPI001E65B7AE|nr:UDP-N-acetylglucosamine--undecaprenyl-phosphate N-acetylglucosaminephosphotransferase [Vibrio salinus]MCE0493800.1 UDP-N-acetylglucosamine--undecaprenyl-phosphate N-acetylglucosaminephosphotransferase [Vibrio salinus]
MLPMLISIFFVSFVSLFFLRKVAQKIDLVDIPNTRKQHHGTIPLVGGIAITVTLVCILTINPDLLQHVDLYLFCIIVLALLGALDDKYDLSVSLRMGIQAALSVLVLYKGNLSLESFGNLLGSGNIELGSWGVIVTIIAVIGAINAFNMVDGIDGLLGGLAIVTFSSLGILLTIQQQTMLAQFCWIIITTLLPYIAMNLGYCGKKRKVFMGDAGSMVIGFTVVWLLMALSQTNTSTVISNVSMKPVTALWIIAIPLMDMTAIMIRRMLQGRSPLKPDRGHLHHILQRIGFSTYQTLVIIVSLGAFFALIGIFGEYANIADEWMFIGFMICFIGYYYVLNYLENMTTPHLETEASHSHNNTSITEN